MDWKINGNKNGYKLTNEIKKIIKNDTIESALHKQKMKLKALAKKIKTEKEINKRKKKQSFIGAQPIPKPRG